LRASFMVGEFLLKSLVLVSTPPFKQNEHHSRNG
jgi:hypothetical protein